MLKTLCKKMEFPKICDYYIYFWLTCICLRNIGLYIVYVPPVFDYILFSCISVFGCIVALIAMTKNNFIGILKKNTWFVAFIICLVFSMLINYKYGISQNLKDMVWTLISFLVLYLYAGFQNEKDKILKMIKIQNIVIIFWFVASLLSILTGLVKLEHIFYLKKGGWIGIGIVENRLFGVFANPNSASIVAVLALMFSYFQVFYPYSNSLNKKFNIFNIALQFIYIALAESRGSEMILLMLVAMVGFSVFWRIIRSANTTKRFFASLFMTFVLVLTTVFLIWLILKIFGSLWSFEGKFFSESQTLPGIFRSHSIGKRSDYVDNNDISNLRFGIWLSAFEIFKKNWFLGVSHGNILKYALDNFPEGFIAVRKYTHAHSVWVGIPIYTGVCGAVCIFGFFLQSFWKIILYFKNNFKRSHPVVAISSLMAIGVWVYGLVESEILFVNSVCSFLFWVFLGFAMNYFNSQKSLIKGNCGGGK